MKLSEIEQELEKSFPSIGHISVDELASSIGSDTRLILLDVRTEAEFDVSHLPGAIRVHPDTSPEALLAMIGDVEDARIVAYCSVGWRSSILAGRSSETLRGAGASDIDNLRGGVFAWHNDERPLQNALGPTDQIHPFDKTWGKLVERTEKLSYTAVEK